MDSHRIIIPGCIVEGFYGYFDADANLSYLLS